MGRPPRRKGRKKTGVSGGGRKRGRGAARSDLSETKRMYGALVTVVVFDTAGKNDNGSGNTRHDTTRGGEGDGAGWCLTGGGGAAATHVPRRRGKGTPRSGRHGSGHAQGRGGGSAAHQIAPQRQRVGGRLCPPPFRLPTHKPRALLWPERTAHSRHCRSSQWQRGGGGDDWQLGPTGARPGGCPRFGSLPRGAGGGHVA